MLIFEPDSILCGGSPFGLHDFVDYGFVGAAWDAHNDFMSTICGEGRVVMAGPPAHPAGSNLASRLPPLLPSPRRPRAHPAAAARAARHLFPTCIGNSGLSLVDRRAMLAALRLERLDHGSVARALKAKKLFGFFDQWVAHGGA